MLDCQKEMPPTRRKRIRKPSFRKKQTSKSRSKRSVDQIKQKISSSFFYLGWYTHTAIDAIKLASLVIVRGSLEYDRQNHLLEDG